MNDSQRRDRDLASNGFPWAEVCTRLSEQAAALVAEMNPDGCAYYPDGHLDRARCIDDACQGSPTRSPSGYGCGDRMLDGPVGDAIVEAVQSRGGVLDRREPRVRARRVVTVHHSNGRRHGSCGRRPRRRTVHRCSTRSTPTAADAGAVYRNVLAAIGRARDVLADPSGTSIVSAGDRTATWS